MGCGWPVVTGSFETLEKGLENHENIPFKIVLFENNMWSHVRIRLWRGSVILEYDMLHVSLNFIRLLRVVITPSVRGENDLKQSDEFQANM